MIRHDAPDGWAINARLYGVDGLVEIGTGFSGADETSARNVRINGENVRGTAALGEYVRTVWLTPSMDGLFTGAAGDRRRFLDRLIQSLDPAYRSIVSRFERAMRQRNRLLETGETNAALYEGLELQMAETGVAMAATRLNTVTRLARLIGARKEGTAENPFPWAELALEGLLEERLQGAAAVDVEDLYLKVLAEGRVRDRAARRTLDGPHRSDLAVGHGPKAVSARKCSTGEQKALLVGLVLAHAHLVMERNAGYAPLILLDEVAAHLDETRRAALFNEISHLNAQAWMTGTDAAHFAPLGADAQLLKVDNGGVSA
jgi:DNA replication and repair protein RecF